MLINIIYTLYLAALFFVPVTKLRKGIALKPVEHAHSLSFLSMIDTRGNQTRTYRGLGSQESHPFNGREDVKI
jgi:hypothetical protein